MALIDTKKAVSYYALLPHPQIPLRYDQQRSSMLKEQVDTR